MCYYGGVWSPTLIPNFIKSHRNWWNSVFKLRCLAAGIKPFHFSSFVLRRRSFKHTGLRCDASSITAESQQMRLDPAAASRWVESFWFSRKLKAVKSLLGMLFYCIDLASIHRGVQYYYEDNQWCWLAKWLSSLLNVVLLAGICQFKLVVQMQQ